MVSPAPVNLLGRICIVFRNQPCQRERKYAGAVYKLGDMAPAAGQS
jgi:hypothetical protein